MLTALLILIILASVLLVVVILVQNPKGGGLSSAFGNLGSNVMGARQTADVIEKATWYLAIGIIVMVMFTYIYIPTDTTSAPQDTETIINPDDLNQPIQAPQQQQQQQPGQPQTFPQGGEE